MNLFDIYEPWIGSANSFKKEFQDNEALFTQANQYWHNLESNSLVFLLFFIGAALVLSYFYYIPFNNKPGRHYKLKYWSLFGLICFFATMLITFLYAYLMCNPQLDGAILIIFKLALANSIYATVLYFVISVVWCNYFPTNAYRFFKF